MLSIVSLNTSTDVYLTNSIFNLLIYFHHHPDQPSSNFSDYLSCLLNLFSSRESIDDVIWARVHKDLHTTPLRSLLHLVQHHQFTNIYSISLQLSSILSKLSSFLSNFSSELFIWLYTWLKGQKNIEIEHYLSQIIEKSILNPYPLVEKQTSSNSLLVIQSRDVSQTINEYLDLVFMQISLFFEPIIEISPSKLRNSYLFDENPDFYQIKLKIKLNLHEKSKNIEEISENLNILIANGGFSQVFDEILEKIEEKDFICEIIQRLDQVKEKSIKNSKKLFECLEIQPKNEKLIRFCANYLEAEYRIQFLFYAKDYLDIILEEIEKNEEVKQENFVEMLLEFEPVQQRTVEAMLLVIKRAKNNAENVLKLKQKKIWKLAKVNYEDRTMNERVAELIVK